MNIILAQLKKDVIAARPLFWAWAACIAVCATLGAVFLLPIHPGLSKDPTSAVLFGTLVGLGMGALMLMVAQYVLMAILAVRVVQADSLVDPDAFWRTRPISRPQLMGEKTLFLILLMLGTQLAAFVMQTHSGGSAGRQLGGMVADEVSFLKIMAGLFALAAVTADLSKLVLTFLMCGIGGSLAASLLWALISAARRLAGPGNGETLAPAYHGLAGHAAILGPEAISALCLGGFVLVIVFQYLTLRTTVARWMLAGTFFVAAFVGN